MLSWYTKVYICNRPGVAGVVLQHPGHWFINWLIKWSFSSISSGQHYFQTVKAKDMKFWDNVHSCVSCVTCPWSRFRCHVSCVTWGGTHWWSHLVEVLLSTGPTPSSFMYRVSQKKCLFFSQSDSRMELFWDTLYFYDNTTVFNRGSLFLNIYFSI